MVPRPADAGLSREQCPTRTDDDLQTKFSWKKKVLSRNPISDLFILFYIDEKYHFQPVIFFIWKIELSSIMNEQNQFTALCSFHARLARNQIFQVYFTPFIKGDFTPRRYQAVDTCNGFSMTRQCRTQSHLCKVCTVHT